MLCAACIINLHVAFLDVSFILSFFPPHFFLTYLLGETTSLSVTPPSALSNRRHRPPHLSAAK